MYHKHVKNHTILLCGIEEKEDAMNEASEGFLNVFFSNILEKFSISFSLLFIYFFQTINITQNCEPECQ